MSEVAMWLFPVMLASMVGLFIGLRYGLRWTWGLCVQQTLILIASAIGFLYLYPPAVFNGGHPDEHIASFWATLAWVFFAAFNLGQRLILNAYSLDLALFKIREATSKAWLVKLLAWGPPGEYWNDMARSLAFFSERKKDEAMAIVHRWNTDPRLPQNVRESLVGFSMLGRVLLGDWEGIVEEFEQFKNSFTTTRTIIPFQMASRAYAELGRMVESVACLEFSAVPTARVSATTIDINFMTFFALAGAIDELENLLKVAGDKRAIPPYVRLYWLGRCLAVRGDTSKAIATFEECKATTPVELETWRGRTEAQLNKQLAIADGNASQLEFIPHPNMVARARHLYARARLSIDLVRPTQIKAGVIWLMVSLIVAYVVTNADQFLGNSPQWTELHKRCYALGELDWNSLKNGQWWRLITYMFLHGNTAHLLLNTGALFIFGKSVENIYGTGRFLVIYVFTGVFSGLAQVMLMPNDAAIGASGAILGIFGAAMAGVVRLKHVLPPSVRKSELRWMLSVAAAQAIFDQLVNSIAAATDKTNEGVRIAAFAHLGGIVAGFLIGMVMPMRRFEDMSGTGDHKFHDGNTPLTQDLLK
jgi:membrane associated rhomboid family serine protease